MSIGAPTVMVDITGSAGATGDQGNIGGEGGEGNGPKLDTDPNTRYQIGNV
ncbi:hypothetical protein K438DRAFT_1998660 [Mycena galopus ATCC 62051]|nr:hypothetical protein K438DRAFT_1998660 [Mycena galopus ATCC 62051]